MSLDGGPEYPVTTDLSDAASGSLALAEEPIAFDVEAIRATSRSWNEPSVGGR